MLDAIYEDLGLGPDSYCHRGFLQAPLCSSRTPAFNSSHWFVVGLVVAAADLGAALRAGFLTSTQVPERSATLHLLVGYLQACPSGHFRPAMPPHIAAFLWDLRPSPEVARPTKQDQREAHTQLEDRFANHDSSLLGNPRRRVGQRESAR